MKPSSNEKATNATVRRHAPPRDDRTAVEQATHQVWEAGPPDSHIQFSLRHLVLTEITGVVGRWRAKLALDPEHPIRSSVEVVADAGSLETGVVERDNHMRSAEFLDILTFPEIHFRSTDVRLGEDQGRYLIVGDLTIRDVTREVTMVAERLGPSAPLAAGSRLDFAAYAIVNRQDFGLRWNQDLDRGGLVASDRIDLRISVAARPSGAGS